MSILFEYSKLALSSFLQFMLRLISHTTMQFDDNAVNYSTAFRLKMDLKGR